MVSCTFIRAGLNDDNLGSTWAEPVEASPWRNRPFDPITGLKADDGKTEAKLGFACHGSL